MPVIELNPMIAVSAAEMFITILVKLFLLYVLQISNDGLTYSNAKTMIIYDGACQICELQESGLCALKVYISSLCLNYKNMHLFR